MQTSRFRLGWLMPVLLMAAAVLFGPVQAAENAGLGWSSVYLVAGKADPLGTPAGMVAVQDALPLVAGHLSGVLASSPTWWTVAVADPGDDEPEPEAAARFDGLVPLPS